MTTIRRNTPKRYAHPFENIYWKRNPGSNRKKETQTTEVAVTTLRQTSHRNSITIRPTTIVNPTPRHKNENAMNLASHFNFRAFQIPHLHNLISELKFPCTSTWFQNLNLSVDVGISNNSRCVENTRKKLEKRELKMIQKSGFGKQWY
jgi:hypothetical protein